MASLPAYVRSGSLVPSAGPMRVHDCFFSHIGTATAAERQTVVITGASAGVGRATAHRFAQAGARIGLVSRDRRSLNKVKSEVEALGGTAMAAALDVADAPALLAAADKFSDAFGPIDIWINDAMATVFSPVADIEPEEFKRVTEVTYLGCVYGTQAALHHMLGRDRGVIVQVGSALAYRGIPLQAAYCGAKYAIRGFTDSLRSELIHNGSDIKLTMVDLPAVNTPQFDWARTHLPRQPRPVPPVVQPEAIADVIYCASLRPKREYWVGQSTLKAILGNIARAGGALRIWKPTSTEPQRNSRGMAAVASILQFADSARKAQYSLLTGGSDANSKSAGRRILRS